MSRLYIFWWDDVKLWKCFSQMCHIQSDFDIINSAIVGAGKVNTISNRGSWREMSTRQCTPLYRSMQGFYNIVVYKKTSGAENNFFPIFFILTQQLTHKTLFYIVWMELARIFTSHTFTQGLNAVKALCCCPDFSSSFTLTPSEWKHTWAYMRKYKSSS